MRDSQIGTINDYYQNTMNIEKEKDKMINHFPKNVDAYIAVKSGDISQLSLVKTACGKYEPVFAFNLDLFDCDKCLEALIDDLMDNTTIDEDEDEDGFYLKDGTYFSVQRDYDWEYELDEDDYNEDEEDLYIDDQEYNDRLSMWLDTQGWIGAGR